VGGGARGGGGPRGGPGGDAVGVRLDGGEADVDGVAEEDAGERAGQHRLDAEGLEHAGGVLAGRPAAEVPAADHEVARLDPPGEVGVEVFQAVRGQGGDVLGQEAVAPAGDVVRADVVAEPMDRAGLLHGPSTWRGSTIRPATAAAATATGEAR